MNNKYLFKINVDILNKFGQGHKEDFNISHDNKNINEILLKLNNIIKERFQQPINLPQFDNIIINKYEYLG